MKILLIDNYDSFTYNLVQRIGELDAAIPIHVVRNDRISVEEALALAPSHLIISPGPCTPKETAICPSLIREFRGRIPILGVCLGHQTIGDVHGMEVVRHHRLMHGKTSPIHHDDRGIFEGLPNPFTATRYHSLIVRPETVAKEFEISAWTDDNEVMGLRWRAGSSSTPEMSGPEDRSARWRPPTPGGAPMDGVQFHPESFLTTCGPMLLANFLSLPRPVVEAEAFGGAIVQ